MAFEIYKNKRVFLSGHTGFKGSWLGLWLKHLGARTYGYSLEPETTPNHFDLLGGSKLYEKSEFNDILNQKALEKALFESKAEIIFHLAAQPLVRRSYKEPFETFNTNVMGTLNILQAARGLKSLKAIVVITTDKVYENKEWIYAYRENEALGGYDPYSASKACAEIVINSMRQSFFNEKDFNKTHKVLIASARAGNVIGGGDWSEDRLVPDLIHAYAAKKRTLIRNPDATRPWQHVLEPLRGYLILGEKLLKGEKDFATSFNLGPDNDSNLSVKEVLELCKYFWDKIEFEIKPDKNAPHEARLLMLDISKARNKLGYKPILGCKEGIKETMKWYKAFYEKGEVSSLKQLKDYLKLIQKQEKKYAK